uniref:Uncharacterized protein n=1 Tax=Anguilla anguilla TaxID=7936 RepID=A0A0E9W062_ANGAN
MPLLLSWTCTYALYYGLKVQDVTMDTGQSIR